MSGFFLIFPALFLGFYLGIRYERIREWFRQGWNRLPFGKNDSKK